MSSYTKNLNLLKKDPVTDGSETFNIKTMMNDNWDKIDAALPGGDVKSAPVEGDTVLLYDSEDPQKGKPKKTLLSALISMVKPERIGAVKIQTGSYVGTGTYGENNPTGITLPFTPKFIFIIMDQSESYPYYRTLGFLTEHSSIALISYTEKMNWLMMKEWGTKVSWYANSYSSAQDARKPEFDLNLSGETYYYYAFG